MPNVTEKVIWYSINALGLSLVSEEEEEDPFNTDCNPPISAGFSDKITLPLTATITPRPRAVTAKVKPYNNTVRFLIDDLYHERNL